MEEDLLKILGDPLATYESLGIDGHVLEALQRGDLQTVILSMLLEQNSDPMLATLMQVMLGRDHTAVVGSAGQEAKPKRTSRRGPADGAVPGIENGRPDARATLRRVALILGACSACCGEEVSCPDCHGSGKPGSVQSIASAPALRAWLDPALGRMGMHITNPALPAASPHEDPMRPISV
jgi:hypothetical protein